MKKFLKYTISLQFIIFLYACQSSKKTQVMNTAQSSGSEVLYAHQWKLVSLNGMAVNNSKAMLLFYPGQVNRVAGNAGCNKLSGTFELGSSNRIKFSPLAVTKMACAFPTPENEFLEALTKTTTWSIVNNELLLGDAKQVFAKLTASRPESARLDGTWELNYISGTKITFEGLYPGKKPFIRFETTKGQAGGNSSCNVFSTTIKIEENNIQFGKPLSTMIFCEGGGEKAFFDMLEKVNRFSVTDDTLTLLIDDVAVMRFARKENAAG